MNQIPNIEKTMRRGIKLIAGRIEALHPQYFLDETTYKHDVKGTMDVVKGVMADIEETHHHQLQKARRKAKLDGYKFAIQHFRERLEIDQTFADAVTSMEKLTDQAELEGGLVTDK